MRALAEPVLQDRFGRRFPYLRVSVTDVCNFRCSYCLPGGYEKGEAAGFLTVDEIRRLVTAFAATGTFKVRLTGGEPTLRSDFCDIAATVAAVPGISRLAFTTNGYRLPERARAYFEAGLRAINVSIDSLDRGTFARLTGHDRLGEVMAGVEAALAAGFDGVKINAVLLRGVNDEALDRFLSYVEARPISIRFIELMETGQNRDYFRTHHVSASVLREGLLARGFSARARADGAGPAVEYEHPSYQGTIGLIAPYEKDFCDSCNRLRVSARGELHLCLFGERGHDLRPLLQRDSQQPELEARLSTLLGLKRSGHLLHQGDPGIRQHFASLGG